jgi:hypothetical protein
MNAQTHHKSDNDRGSAFLAILFFIMLIGLAAGSMGVMLSQDLFTNRRIVDRSKAQQVADGAAQQAIALMIDDITNLTTPSSEMQSGTMGDGTYNVAVSNVGGGVYAVTAQGTVNSLTRTVKVYVRLPTAGLAFTRGIFANGDLIGHGGGYVANGTHSNQDSDFHGNIEVRGDASSCGTTSLAGAATVTGTASSGAARIDFPELDFDHYYNIAVANGEVYVGDMVLSGTYSPPGGVMWIIGNVDTKGTTTINGAIFATGNIEDHGKTTLNQQGDLPALVSRDGYISFHGKSRFEGLIYTASGQVILHGSTAITGSIVSFGAVDSQGNWGQLDYNEQDPEIKNDAVIKVLAWEY